MVQEILEQAMEEGRKEIVHGETASYIPELGNVDKNHLGICIYTAGGEVFSAGPYLTDDSGDPLLPGIANGFYRLIDRHSDAGDGQNLLERASLNVTLAVYDADSDTLYFCEMDT